VVEGAALATPPATPATGACYLVATGASGSWTGRDGALAGFTDGGWRFVSPKDGMQVLDRASGQLIQYRSGAWESGIVRAQEFQVGGMTVIRQRQPGIADPIGGSVVDVECRMALTSVLATLRTHGLIA
jgi:hypothetical protein